ncbi:uncharacterized protein LOC106780674 [Vigna radiata var. radiata]|uniref:RNA-directed DNA polymerase n=1 Tax=Vigna radiata var. radiata TaxID=3916 RepID=A0A1S3W1T5_VIGRR|nr:uncharacterized protein LOC106780674 [Vigna radiata var. radiata]
MEVKPTRMTLQLVYRSVKYPFGVIEDVLVKVDKFTFPVDFVILDMEEDTEVPLILGRPFMKTARVIIDVDDGHLKVRLHDETITFNVVEVMQHPKDRGNCFRVEVLDDVVEKVRSQMYVKSPLERVLVYACEELTVEEESEVEEISQHLEKLKEEKSTDVKVEKLEKADLDDQEKMEFKMLPDHLKYVFLEENSKKPVIISKSLSNSEEEKLTMMEQDFKPIAQPQRRLNPMLKEVMRKEVLKLLEAGMIYPISDSAWNLDVVLKRCIATNLVLNWEKCHFMVREGIVLGHKISSRGIGVDQAKVDVIEKLPPPTNVKGVRSFLGHVGFYRRFIKDFSKIAKPLCNLLVKDTPFEFDGECLKAFEVLKEKLISAPVVVAPNWTQDFELMCDASDYAIGAVLGQRCGKIFHVIHYANKVLNGAQLNYALEKFRPYLIGSKIIIYTDHSAIKYLLAKSHSKPHLIRWVLLLQEFDLETKDKKGSENVIADHLSRLLNTEVTDKEGEIKGEFIDERLMLIQQSPWFADIANFKAAGILLDDLTWQQKKKFIHDSKECLWDDPYLFKLGADRLFRRCVTVEEAVSILWHCHNSPYGGHFNGERTAAKVLQSGFFWPTLFKDAHAHAKGCDKCQRTGSISKRHEMSLQAILEVEVFDCWGMDFMGPLPSSYNNEYILVAVDYVSKWVEAATCQKNDAKTMVKFLKRQIFSRFGVPRIIISDGGSHFCNAQLAKTNGQAEVSNREIKRILEKTVSSSRKDWAIKLDDVLLAYRTALKTPIGLTPFQLVHGKRKLQLQELEEMRMTAYDSSRKYKERVKMYHDKKLIKREFQPGQQAVKPYGVVELMDPKSEDPNRNWIVNELERRKWDYVLANLPDEIDEVLVKEFYVNAWDPERSQTPNTRASTVQGKTIRFDRKALNRLMHTLMYISCPLCTFMSSHPDHDLIASTLYLPSYGYQLGTSGTPMRILRKHLNSLATIWSTFSLTNI